MCDRIVFEDPFLIVYWPDKYITKKMCDEAVNDSLAILKLIPDWFVTNEMIKKIFAALYADENILYFDEGFDDAIFNCNEMGILNIDLTNIILMIILMKMVLILLFLLDFWLGILTLSNAFLISNSQGGDESSPLATT